MKRKISIPFVSWRDGRPRFEPGPKMRDLGFSGTSLRHPMGEKIDPASLETGTKNTGDWFGPGEAMDWSAAFAKRMAEAQKKAKDTETKRPAKTKQTRAPALRKTRKKGPYPLGRLIEDWKRSPSFRDDKAEKTRRDYASKMSVLEEAYPDVWAAEIDALD
ncbi:MAG: hypothetical protein JJ866_15890 [Roseibium sp.]|uniref:hypothetical protein n=1 Tax=Roseibium sp. TaxID=1936156 RepID=UPI001B1FD0DC|nr:hypothetical protein [Roseibium sp.]MBO6893425.1 hypothetical protein [Roseibium sp.]MBO6930608.1 hypothetical protein [Roseibium sp.]